ncbi:MAG: serine/threonine-protein phosphatase [Opitutaceae bacterium]|nr:serine/threonine-protein phosphatase [Opitutaceae bacterium]
MISIRAAALTDIGRVRRNNEDRLLIDAQLGLFGVADGVGGLPGGAEAATLVLESVTGGIRAAGETPDLTAIVRAANDAVYQLGRTLSPDTGIGSTLTLGHIRGTDLQIAHVGDSRCYALRDDRLELLTSDHSVENEVRARRARGESVFFHEGNRNALTRCMGQPFTLDVDIIDRPLRPRDRYLFCTDGITRLVDEPELADMLGKNEEPEPLLREIIALAIRRGGPDNATGVLLYVDNLS